MKRMYQVLLFFYVLLLAGTALITASNIINSNIFYKDSILVSIMTNPNHLDHLSVEEQISDLNDFASENNILLTKRVWNSNKEFYIYTNDLTLNGYVKSKFKSLKRNEFLSNVNKKYDSYKIDWFDNRENIRIYSLYGLNNIGVEGEYFVRGDNLESIDNFLKIMQKSDVFNVKKSDVTYSNTVQILKTILSQPIVFVSNLVIILVLFCSLLFVYIQSSKKCAIQTLFGYTRFELISSLLKLSMLSIISAFFVSTLGILGYMYLVFKSFKLLHLFSVIFFSGVFLIVILIMLITILWLLIFNKSSINEYVKNKKTYGLLMIFSKIFQVIFLFLIPVLIIETYVVITELKHFEKSNQNWENTQNIFSTSVQYITDSYLERRPSEEKIKNFYKKNMSLFALISVDNFNILSNGEFLYNANTDSKKKSLTSPDGRNITINSTFLDWNPIYDETGKRLTIHDLSMQHDSFNILVPKKFKKYVSEIKEEFYEDFIFKTYTIPHDIYEENINKIEPKFNIIYVDNNQQYFTYRSDILGDIDNIIIDPTVIVDIGNFDASFYHAWFTQSIYFKKDKGKTGSETILPLVSQENMGELIQVVTPIYNNRANEIKSNKKMLMAYILFVLLLIFSIILCVHYFYLALFNNNKQTIFVKYHLGYTRKNIYLKLYSFWLVFDIFVFYFSSLYFDLEYKNLFAVLLIVGELISIKWLEVNGNMEKYNDYFK